MKKTIAAHMLDIMEEEGINTVHLGLPVILEKCCSRSGNSALIKLDPRKRHQRILNALEKSPLFIKISVKRPDRPTVTARGFCIHYNLSQKKQNKMKAKADNKNARKLSA